MAAPIIAGLLRALPALSELGAAIGLRTGAGAAAGKLGAAEATAQAAATSAPAHQRLFSFASNYAKSGQVAFDFMGTGGGSGIGGANGPGGQRAPDGRVLTDVGPNNARSYSKMLGEAFAEASHKRQSSPSQSQQNLPGWLTMPGGKSMGDWASQAIAAAASIVPFKLGRDLKAAAGTAAAAQTPSDVFRGFAENMKRGVFGGVPGMMAGSVGNTLLLAKAPWIIESWSGQLLESYKHLRMFNSQLSVVYAQMDYQTRLLNVQQAAATSGTTGLLASNYMGLQRELQPLREIFTTMRNMGANYLVLWARGLAFATKNSGLLAQINIIGARILEKLLGAGGGQLPYADFMADIAKGNWGPRGPNPKNKKPGKVP